MPAVLASSWYTRVITSHETSLTPCVCVVTAPWFVWCVCGVCGVWWAHHRRGELTGYMELLVRNFNASTLDGLMCRTTVRPIMIHHWHPRCAGSLGWWGVPGQLSGGECLGSCLCHAAGGAQRTVLMCSDDARRSLWRGMDGCSIVRAPSPRLRAHMSTQYGRRRTDPEL